MAPDEGGDHYGKPSDTSAQDDDEDVYGDAAEPRLGTAGYSAKDYASMATPDLHSILSEYAYACWLISGELESRKPSEDLRAKLKQLLAE
jgi:hypothetical protein